MKGWRQNQLRHMLKTLADDSRLSMLRLLNSGELSVGELAQRVDLSEPTVSHHLSRLREAGLVSLRMAGTQRFYTINQSGLTRFKHMTAEIEQTPPAAELTASDESWIDALGWSEAEAAVLRACTENGVMTHIPRARKKLLIILRWLATKFEVDRRYIGSEVNEILKAAYPEDYVSLRRDLVDFRYLRREKDGSTYWRERDQDTEG